MTVLFRHVTDNGGHVYELTVALARDSATRFRFRIDYPVRTQGFPRGKKPVYYNFTTGSFTRTDFNPRNPLRLIRVGRQFLPVVPKKVLWIIAGPGVRIVKFSEGSLQPELNHYFELRVIRLQNPYQVPVLASPFDLSRIMTSYFVDLRVRINAIDGLHAHYYDSRVDGHDDAAAERVFDTSRYSALFDVQEPVVLVPWSRHQAFRTNMYRLLRRNWDRSPATMAVLPPREQFIINKIYNGVEIRHPYSFTVLRITVPAFHESGQRRRAHHQQAFYYYFKFHHRQPFVKILHTANVTIEAFQDFDLSLLLFNNPVSLSERRRSLEIKAKRVSALDSVPLQELATLLNPPVNSGRGFRTVLIESDREAVSITKGLMDLYIGVIPILGPIVDIGEFIYASTTGRNRWGDEVSRIELTLMGFGALLGAVDVGSRVARPITRLVMLARITRALRVLDYSEEEIRTILAAVRAGNYSREETEMVIRLEARVVRGIRLTQIEELHVTELLRRLPDCSA